MKAAMYARVSQEEQAKGDRISIDQQLAEMQSLCERMGWDVDESFVDAENYRATQPPNKGMVVNPSGERADRPRFVAMLELLKAGTLDILVCWRDDRLVRHPRVAVALEDALDIGDAHRNGRPKIEIRDATGALIDRFTLSIKATIWREENKRRAERNRMGKVATLQQGRWPGAYKRYGYTSRKDGRGRIIEIDEDEAAIVLKVHQMFDAGAGVREIRKYLMQNEIAQKGHQSRVHEWCACVIYNMIHAEDYTGVARWKFADGTIAEIQIPAIVPHELWARNQARIEKDKYLSRRNSHGVYVLQGIARCGDCESTMYTRGVHEYTSKKGQRRPLKTLRHDYYCAKASQYPDEPHPRPYTRSGPKLDWLVWRYIVDKGINRPDLIREQVQARQAELLSQGDGVNSEIAHARRRLAEVDQERAFFQRQAARGMITEQEFDARMVETKEGLEYWQDELGRLMELRDDAAKVKSALEYVTELLATLQEIVPDIDQTPKQLRAIPAEERYRILGQRQTIIRALCDRVLIFADGRVRIEGLINGDEAGEFGLGSSSSC